MAKTMGFQEFYDFLCKKTDEIKNGLEDLLLEDTVEIPPLHEMKDTNNRYIYYSEAVKRSIRTSKLLSNAFFTKDAVERTKRKIVMDQNIPTKLLNQYTRELDGLISSLDGLVVAAKTYKEGIDNVLKFYQSACFMFGSILETNSQI